MEGVKVDMKTMYKIVYKRENREVAKRWCNGVYA